MSGVWWRRVGVVGGIALVHWLLTVSTITLADTFCAFMGFWTVILTFPVGTLVLPLVSTGSVGLLTAFAVVSAANSVVWAMAICVLAPSACGAVAELGGTSWRRRIAVVAVIALVHFGVSWGTLYAVVVHGLSPMCCDGSAPAHLRSWARILYGFTAYLRMPLGDALARQVDRGLSPLQWYHQLGYPVTCIRWTTAASHALNSILWAVALHSLWSLAQAVRQRRKAP